ncbi:MAG: efflux RND transporter periplasmic adaptor subunit [Planctomycetota bacterium]
MIAHVDVEALRIDRTATARQRRGDSIRWLPWAAVALLLAGGYLFRAPILGWIDRARLPKVRVLQVSETSRAAVGAVRGTASNGYVVAARRAALSADTPGRIVELNVTEGSVVKKGDVVARLYSDEYRAALERARADLRTAQAAVQRARAAHELAQARVASSQRLRDATRAGLAEAGATAQLAQTRLARTEDLVGRGVQAQDALDEATASRDAAVAAQEAAAARLAAAEVDVTDAEQQVAVAAGDLAVAEAQGNAATAGVELAQATLDKTEVRAPFDGVVVLKDAEVGEVVSPNSQGGSNARGSVCTMVDFGSLEVQADVPETALAAVRLGGAAEVFLDAFPEAAYHGRVDRVWPTANRQKATVEVRVKLLEPDDRLRPEMGVRVVFLPDDAPAEPSAGGEAGILVPEASVVEVSGKSGVFLLERDVARFQAIELGERKNARVEVRTGLRPGQRIVLDPPDSLQDGDRVLVAQGS